MTRHLKAKTLHGMSWSFAERIGTLGVQFLISIVLARLLMPAQFGLIAMLALFMAVAQSFLDSGFGSALIQKQDATRVDESSIFYFNIVVGVIAAGLLCLAAPAIAAFYKRPILTPLTRVLSLNLVINSFGLIQTSLMTKRVDFKTQMKITMLSAFLAGLAGIVMAYRGFGVWSLVAQSLGANIGRTALLWVYNSWRPVRAFSFKSLRAMFGFGSKMLAAGLLDTVYNNAYYLVIGKVFSPTDLGYFLRARTVQQLPGDTLSFTVGRVTFPVYAAVQDDKVRLKRGVKQTLTTLTMLNFPLMIGLALTARALVSFVYSDKWLPCVPYLQLMCFTGILNPMQSANLNVLRAQGRSDLYFWTGVLKKVLSFVALGITFRWGIIQILYGQIVSASISYYINSYYTAKFLKYTIWEQVRDVLPVLGIALAMGVGVYAVGLIPVHSQALRLAMQIVAGAALYTALCLAFKVPSFRLVLDMVGPRLMRMVGVNGRTHP